MIVETGPSICFGRRKIGDNHEESN